MVLDHSPIVLSTALDRLHHSIIEPQKIVHKVHVNTWFKEQKPLKGVERNIAEKYLETYCRVRKFK